MKTENSAQLYGDHPTLDLMNTVMTVDEAQLECWTSDADVLAWLRVTVNPDVVLPSQAGAGLLAAARALRERLRALVITRKDEGRVDADALNALLSRSSRQFVAKSEEQGMRLARRYVGDDNDALLAPVVEASAQSLAEDRFDLVKRCENPACTLWFLDKSTSHKRCDCYQRPEQMFSASSSCPEPSC